MRVRRGLTARSLLCPLALALAACGGGGAAGGGAGGAGGGAAGPPVQRSHTAGVLVLRLQELGGLLPPGARAASLPAFSLYGDGLAVTPAGSGVPPAYGQVRLPAAQVDALVEQAVVALRPGPVPDFALRVADAPTSVLTVVTAGGKLQVSAPALSLPTGQVGVPGDLRARWARLQALRGTLTGFAGRVTPPATAGPLAVLAVEGEPGSRAWPYGSLATLPLVQGAHCVVLRGARASMARRALATGPRTWLAGGRSWLVLGRPLLPDERSCASLVS